MRTYTEDILWRVEARCHDTHLKMPSVHFIQYEFLIVYHRYFISPFHFKLSWFYLTHTLPKRQRSYQSQNVTAMWQILVNQSDRVRDLNDDVFWWNGWQGWPTFDKSRVMIDIYCSNFKWKTFNSGSNAHGDCQYFDQNRTWKPQWLIFPGSTCLEWTVTKTNSKTMLSVV